MRAFDARIAGLAKMVRSDNESLARQIVADQASSKQALRAMKELQASLPAEVIETVQRRMDDLAESVAKSQEMLAQRIDRMASKIGERYDNDIQIVIDRMGDAMHALASLGRTPRATAGARTGSSSSSPQASWTSASLRRIGYSSSVALERDPHVEDGPSRVGVERRTLPPATIVSPMKTGARNCTRSRFSAAASPSHATMHVARCAIVNIPCATIPGSPRPPRRRRPGGAGSGRRKRRRTPSRLARDDLRQRRDLIADGDLLEPRAHAPPRTMREDRAETTSTPSSPSIRVRIVRNS